MNNELALQALNRELHRICGIIAHTEYSTHYEYLVMRKLFLVKFIKYLSPA